jgi:hypothetical protein
MLSEKQPAMVALFERHVGAEFKGDLGTTMATMSASPHLNYVPTMAGGVGQAGVRAFYRDHLIGKFFPPDVKMTSVSRAVGETSVVEEIVISFTHTTVIDRQACRDGGRRVGRLYRRQNLARAHLLGSGQRASADRLAEIRWITGNRR